MIKPNFTSTDSQFLVVWLYYFLLISLPAIILLIVAVIRLRQKKKDKQSKIILAAAVLYFPLLFTTSQSLKLLSNYRDKKHVSQTFSTPLYLPANFPANYNQASISRKDHYIEVHGLVDNNHRFDYIITDQTSGLGADGYNNCLTSQACEIEPVLPNLFYQQDTTTANLYWKKDGSYITLSTDNYKTSIKSDLIKTLQSIHRVDSI